MSTPDKKRKSSAVNVLLSTEIVDYLKAWMMSPEHQNYPYPTEEEKAKMIKDTGISEKQLIQWFSNNRKRYWKPRMEEMGNPPIERGDVVEAAMSNSLAPAIVEYLRAWMMAPEHIENPYPTEEEKADIIASTGVDRKQLSCWFSNNRKRFWKPKVDEIRAQYGLAETDRFPPELLATATFYTPAGSEDMNNAGENNDDEPDNKHQKLSDDIVAV